MSRFARRVDSNQATIVKELRQAGFRVQPGHDDLLVYRNGKLLWVEVKRPPGPRGGTSHSTLTRGQKSLEAAFAGAYLVARSTEDILAWDGWTGN